MRIAQITRQFYPSVGGLEEAVLSLSREVRRAGHDVEVITLNRLFNDRVSPLLGLDSIEDIPIRRLAFYGSRRYPIAPSVLSAIKNADIVHVHGIDFFYDYLAATAFIHRKPLVATTHGGFFHTKYAERMKRYYFSTATALSSRAYRRIFATSENDLKMFDPIAPGKVFLTENGVDIEKWRDRASKSLCKTLLYFGRLSSNKRIDLIFPILQELRKKDPEWRLKIAGRVDDVDFKALHGQAFSAGVLDSTEFYSNPSNAQLAELIGQSSYYICASEYEGFGISAVEAASAGLFPILSRIPAFERFLRTAPGVLMDPTEAVASAVALNQFHSLMKQSTTRQREVLLNFASTFDWHSVGVSTIAAYDDLLRSKSDRHRSEDI